MIQHQINNIPNTSLLRHTVDEYIPINNNFFINFINTTFCLYLKQNLCLYRNPLHRVTFRPVAEACRDSTRGTSRLRIYYHCIICESGACSSNSLRIEVTRKIPRLILMPERLPFLLLRGTWRCRIRGRY